MAQVTLDLSAAQKADIDYLVQHTKVSNEAELWSGVLALLHKVANTYKNDTSRHQPALSQGVVIDMEG